MNRDKFFQMFLFYLGQLPQEEAFKVATYFSDMIEDKIEDGVAADVALKELGDARALASYILKEAYGITPELGKYVEQEQAQTPVNFEPSVQANRQKDYTTDCANIKQINVNIRNIEISAGASADDKIHLKYTESENVTFAVSEAGGGLDLVMTSGANDGFALKGIFGGKKKEPAPVVRVEVPAKYKENIQLMTDGATIQVQGIANANILECSTKNATLRILDTNAASIRARTTNHRLTVTNVNAEKDVDASTSNASIDINKTIGESVSCKTTGSEISLNDVEAKNMLQATTTNAYIAITKISGNYIDLRTSGGKISGTIIGNINDYSITSKSSGGKSNLPNIPFGVKRLSAVTSKENINITFQEPVQ